MKVILIKDMENLGVIGDEVEVRDGYARNYLIPRSIAIKSAKGVLRVVEQKKREKAKREEKVIQQCREIAEKITAVSCTIPMEAGEEEKLFGSVTAEMISEAFKTEGIEIDKKKIVIEEPIKTLGAFNVEIKLHPEVKTQTRIWVVKK
jgi:large subunit ribosomal protein L9